MARIHEYQAKALLQESGLSVPRGEVAASPDEARQIAATLGGPVVVKIQAWTTGRKALGGIAFANTPDEAAVAAERLLAIEVGNFPVEQLLVEERIPIADELLVSLAVDDAARAPMILLSTSGGTGVEDRAARSTAWLATRRTARTARKSSRH